MSFAKQQADAQLELLRKEERWDEALQLCRRMADELHKQPRFHQLTQVLEQVSPDAEQLRAQDTGSSLWLLGQMHYDGRGGVEENWEEAFRCFSRAAEKGHLLSRWRVGSMITYGRGVPQDRERGYPLMVEAAEAGCTAAFFFAGAAYEDGIGVQQSYRRAAQWYLKANANFFLSPLLRDHPLECAPFGEWRPELTPLVPQEIYQAMCAAMVICKRKQLPRYVSLLIASFVCTEGEEWEALFLE